MLNKRSIDLIKYLLDNNLEISLKEASSYFNISERSIRYDIEDINYYLEKNKFSQIEKSQRGIYATEESRENIENFLEDILYKFYIFTTEERKDYLKIKFLFSKDNKLISIAEDLEVSLSTIKSDLKDVKNYFAGNSLELSFISKQGIILEGNEENIRQLQLKFLIKYIGIHKEGYKSKYLNTDSYGLNYIANKILEEINDDNLDLIKLLIKKVEQSLKVTISDEAFNILIFYINLSILRIKTENNIKDFNKNKNFLKSTKEFNIISSEISGIEEYFSVKISEDEILVLTELFLGSHSYNFNHSYLENWIELETTVIKIIKKMSNELKIDLTNDTLLVEGLLNHLKPAYYRIKNNITFENIIANEVKLTYSSLYETVENVTKSILEKYLGKNLPEEEIAYITLHFKTARDRYLASIKQTKNILLVCDLGYASARILTHKLYELYDINIVDNIPYHNFLERTDLKDIDIIISTTDIDSNLTRDIPTLKVHPILSAANRADLISLGLNEYKRKISLREIIELIEGSCTVHNDTTLLVGLKKILKNLYLNDIKDNEKLPLSALLKEENIYLSQKADTWEEAIRRAGNFLLDQGAIEESYIESMIEAIQKNGAYMIMDDKIAFPHARTNNNVLKTDMCLVRFEKPIEFPNKKFIRTLLCFSSKDHKEHMNALNDFINLNDNKDIINEIETASKEHILKLINEI